MFHQNLFSSKSFDLSSNYQWHGSGILELYNKPSKESVLLGQNLNVIFLV